MSKVTNAGALSGLKVLDLSRVLAGPWAGQTLADMGADVIKVERATLGDDTRHWGPPYFNEEASISAYFACANRNKKSITANFDDAQDLQAIKKLAAQADVIIENFKVGQLQKYGLDYPSLRADNEKLIYCSITGFGQSGPYKHKPGYDLLLQASSGMMSVTGEADGQPQKVGVAVIDIFTGLYACIGILAALNERHLSGIGQYIDLALFDVGIAVMANQASNYLCSGTPPTRLGNVHPNIAPYQSFDTADGCCLVAIGNDQQFSRFCEALNCSSLANDSRFSTNQQRVKHREPLVEIIQEIMIRESRQYWLELFERAKLPVAPINTLRDVFNDPQLLSRDMLVNMAAREDKAIPVVGNPIKFSRTPVAYFSAPPETGEHDEEIKQKSFNW